MTTTTSTITVSLRPDDTAETVPAEYFVISNGWVELKNAEHKVVTAYPEYRVSRIQLDTTEPTQ